MLISPNDLETTQQLERRFVKGYGAAAQQVKEALRDSYDRLLAPGIETEFRQSSKEKADKEAIDVFALNLRQLLLAAPLGQRRVLGIDPGFRTGCKLWCAWMPAVPFYTMIRFTLIRLNQIRLLRPLSLKTWQSVSKLKPSLLATAPPGVKLLTFAGVSILTSPLKFLWLMKQGLLFILLLR